MTVSSRAGPCLDFGGHAGWGQDQAIFSLALYPAAPHNLMNVNILKYSEQNANLPREMGIF